MPPRITAMEATSRRREGSPRNQGPNRATWTGAVYWRRIAFAAVGRYNEFENLRIAGVRRESQRLAAGQ
jgi:hypothetical protein